MPDHPDETLTFLKKAGSGGPPPPPPPQKGGSGGPPPPPPKGPVAADGSPLSVIRNAQGQITQASGTGHDRIARSFTVTTTVTTNASGFHFVNSQVDFYENGQQYLQVTTTFSPDAAKSSVQLSSGQSHYGYTTGISRLKGLATVLTTAGIRNTVSLKGIPLSSLSSSTVDPNVPMAIQQATNKTAYFAPLFEGENAQFQAQVEAALQTVGLSTSMSVDSILTHLWDVIPSQMSKNQKSNWTAAGWAAAGGSIALECILPSFAGETAGPVGQAVLYSACVLTGVVASWDASKFGDYINGLPEVPPVPQGNSNPPDDASGDWSNVPSDPPAPSPSSDGSSGNPGTGSPGDSSPGTPDGGTGSPDGPHDGGGPSGGVPAGPDGGTGGGDAGGGGSDGCFVKGTLIATALGLRSIEQIQVDDEVYVFDFGRQDFTTRKVLKVIEAQREEILVLDFGSEQIRCTPAHRFYAGRWVPAQELKLEEVVLSLDGRGRALKGVQRERQFQLVFNLTMDKLHNYFVGQSGLLVHNVKKVGGDPNPEGGVDLGGGLLDGGSSESSA